MAGLTCDANTKPNDLLVTVNIDQISIHTHLQIVPIPALWIVHCYRLRHADSAELDYNFHLTDNIANTN